jgi:hypothetical protein
MVHVPYKGTGALGDGDVMSGQVDSVFAVTSGIGRRPRRVS